MVQWMAYSLIADSACSLLISLTSQLQKTGATDGSRYLFLALAVWAKAAPIFGRFLFFWHSSVACLQLHWNNWVQVRSIICFKRQVCWAYNYYHYDYCFFATHKKIWSCELVRVFMQWSDNVYPWEITMSTGWASQVALSCQEPPVVGTRLVDGRVLLLLFCSLGWGGVG